VAIRDIYPGQQLTKDDFGPATGALPEQLSATERAVVIPLDSAPQVGGQIGAGSHVDVWVVNTQGSGKPILLYQDIHVLGVNGENVTLRTSPRQAGVIIFFASATDRKLWFALRPTVAKNVSASSRAGG
jgi:Flp pilus assembly protein CpaB